MLKTDKFYHSTVSSCDDDSLSLKLFSALDRQCQKREDICQELGDIEHFRELAKAIRNNALSKLDSCLSQFTAKAQENGVNIHWAQTSQQACKITAKIAQDNNVTEIVKSKSMITEEIGLNQFLKDQAIEVIETDLGEFIIQLADHKPSHIVLPAIHLSTDDVTKIFQDKIGYDGPPDPESLTKAARKYLRDKFKSAKMGISGVNFAVAEQGLWTICTNEGNGRYVSNKPDIYLGIMGMERIVEDIDHLSVLLKMLGRFATGQRITQYTNLTHGPCAKDGPSQVHLIILDNGRSDILASKYRDILRCIRCGACLNVCPVFRNIGGHIFPGCYSGPMGSVLLPLLLGMEKAKNVPKACTLCGKCTEVCPVKIPLDEMILELRNDASQAKMGGIIEKLSMPIGAKVMQSPFLFSTAQKLMRLGLKPLSKSGWVKWLPSIPGRWTKVKDLPLPAKHSYQSEIKRKGSGPKDE
ncbi:MAG: iron-sulfur cluster-binding protein [Phycisphaerae bacterium]|nr:iron-sulfur cluster-binding protein [Phycisphaerae bacterium]